MIDARELRIGNWVLVADENTTITCISNQGISCQSQVSAYTFEEFEDIQPILLTKKILLMCGFKYNQPYVFYESPTYTLEGRGFPDLQIDFELMNIPGNWMKLEYVHQLQNLYYALTGRELEIKLI